MRDYTQTKSDDVSRWPLCAKNYAHACHVSCVSGRCAPIGPCLPCRYQQSRCRVQLCMQGVPRCNRTGFAVVTLFCSVCVWFLMSDKLFFNARFLGIHRSGVVTALVWLVPHESAAVSALGLSTPYNHAPCHFMQSDRRNVYACLALTCHLHFFGRMTGILYVLLR